MMNNKIYFLTTVFIIVNVLLIKAQSTLSFPSQMATWQEGYYLSANQIIPERKVLCGDSTINNKTYSKIFSIIFNNQGLESNRFYEGALRSETDFVFWIPKNESMEILLYDWSLESTQTISLQTITGSQNVLVAKSNEYITTSDGVLRRAIVFKSQGGGVEEVWIEGIGSSSGILSRGVNPNESPDYIPFLNCYRYDSEIIFTHPNPPLICNYIFNENCLSTSIYENGNLERSNFFVFPNPFLDEIEIEIRHFDLLEKPILKIFNLQGKEILTTYLQSSKEVISFDEKLKMGIYFLVVSDKSGDVLFRRKMVGGS
jgi:hypothetical protein